MKKVSPQLGKKYSESRKQRLRESMARLKAEGRTFGSPPDPRTRIEKRICQLPSCGKEFDFRIRPKTEPQRGRYCTQKHAVKHLSIERVKVPADFDLLHDLYVVKNMTTPEIGELFGVGHQAVRRRLIDVGIRPRKVGISRYTSCTEDACDKPIYRIQHRTNGSWYGKRCYEHWVAYRKRVMSDYAKRNRPKINAYQQRVRAAAKQKKEAKAPQWLAAAIGP
ncbi:MAG TPA: hypothetical protein VHO25_10115 [Polyangiaceae bacterium]|nr:hypothetical protein [Polyangiaceae bacterium]